MLRKNEVIKERETKNSKNVKPKNFKSLKT